MGTILILAFLTYFSGLVASRASNLNRNPWLWFFLSCLTTPLLAWLILELAGPKNSVVAVENGEQVADKSCVSIHNLNLASKTDF